MAMNALDTDTNQDANAQPDGLRTHRTADADLSSLEFGELDWSDPDRWLEMLRAVHDEVCANANETVAWYSRAKAKKKPRAAGARGLALATALITAGLAVAAQFGFKQPGWTALFLFLATAFILTDSVAGWTQGYLRSTKTRERIQGLLAAFQGDWELSILAAVAAPDSGGQPTLEQVQALLKLACDFRKAMQTAISEETQEWANDFKAGLDQVDALLGKQRNQAAGSPAAGAAPAPPAGGRKP